MRTLTTSSCKRVGSTNASGDDQLEIDTISDAIVFDALAKCGKVSAAASEETPEKNLGGSGYSVAFDPLDGSSVVDANFAVGFIFGVWPGDKLVGRTGRQQVVSGMTQYGPRCTMMLAFPGVTVLEA